MSVTSLQSGRRARSDAQKAAREAAILTAARDLMSDVGIDGVTMAALGRRAGVAKGTLYLYFKTREEVFLKLYADLMSAWCRAIAAATTRDVDAIVAEMARAARADPLFLPLSARLAAVIEANVSDEALYQSKRVIAAEMALLAENLGQRLEIDEAATLDLLRVGFVAFQGAAQMEAACTAHQGTPPEDIRHMFEGSGFEDTFIPVMTRLTRSVIAQ